MTDTPEGRENAGAAPVAPSPVTETPSPKRGLWRFLIGRPIHAECGYFRVGDWGERGMPIDDPKAVPGDDLNWEAFLGAAPKRPFDVSRFCRWRATRFTSASRWAAR